MSNWLFNMTEWQQHKTEKKHIKQFELDLEKYKVYINGYEKCKETYEEDCAFEDMMKKGLTRDFQVIWPVGG